MRTSTTSPYAYNTEPGEKGSIIFISKTSPELNFSWVSKLRPPPLILTLFWDMIGTPSSREAIEARMASSFEFSILSHSERTISSTSGGTWYSGSVVSPIKRDLIFCCSSGGTSRTSRGITASTRENSLRFFSLESVILLLPVHYSTSKYSVYTNEGLYLRDTGASTISTLLFNARPSSVAFEASGLYSPYPAIINLFGSSPWWIKTERTLEALAVDNSQLDVYLGPQTGTLSVCPSITILPGFFLRITANISRAAEVFSLMSADPDIKSVSFESVTTSPLGSLFTEIPSVLAKLLRSSAKTGFLPSSTPATGLSITLNACFNDVEN